MNTNLVKVIHSTRISAPRRPILSNSLKDHTLFNALFEATVLTPVPLGLRDFATAFRHARVHSPILHGSFEEPFTPAHTKFHAVSHCTRRFRKGSSARAVTFIQIAARDPTTGL